MSDESSSSSSDQLLTAAELVRRRAGVGGTKSTLGTMNATTNDDATAPADIDEEIRRLEAELQQGDTDDSDDSSSSSESDEDGESRPTEPQQSGVVLSLSRVKNERIEKLPHQCLPTNTKRKLKNIDHDEDGQRRSKKRKPTAADDGLTQTVKELLNDYQPRSAERLPFYCRVCATQYTNEREFFQHQQTEFHQRAVALERKASFCKLCRKQLTSPAQLKEHISSRPHKGRLQMVQSKQQQGRQSERQCPALAPRPGRNRGLGNSVRQWS